jgi:site-specific recombinase XerC
MASLRRGAVAGWQSQVHYETGHRGIVRQHAAPQRQSAALITTEIRQLVRTCDTGLAALRDRALLLLGYAGALRRSELVGADVEHLRFHAEVLDLPLHSKGAPDGEGQRISMGLGKRTDRILEQLWHPLLPSDNAGSSEHVRRRPSRHSGN